MDKIIISFSLLIDLLTSIIIGWVILVITIGGCYLVLRNIKKRRKNQR